MSAYECAVIGAGDIKDYKSVQDLIASNAFIISADGGLKHCRNMNLKPNLLIGDFDSLESEPPAETEVMPLSKDKNYTDSYFAADEATRRGHRNILLTGMLGGRLDHTMANLGLLALLTRQGHNVLLTDGRCNAHALIEEGKLLLPARCDCYFSLIALTPCQGITILNGKYPLNDYPLSPWDPRAISNEFCGEDVTIIQKSGALAVLTLPKSNLCDMQVC